MPMTIAAISSPTMVPPLLEANARVPALPCAGASDSDARLGLLGRERQRRAAHDLDVLALYGNRPLRELGRGLIADLLRHLTDDLPVTQLAGLGHAQELEAVQRLLLPAEVGLHH